MTEERPSTRRLILFGVAVAIPLAAVALYFAFFDQPAPGPQASQAPAAAAPGEAGSGERSTLPTDHPPLEGRAGGGEAKPAGHPQMGSAGRSVRIPETVKGKWQAVKLQVQEKVGGKGSQVFTVKLGGDLNIAGGKLRVHVGDFLPALLVSGNEVTSASNDPTNPAVLVTVSEGGKDVFRGWLFSKFPDMQPFEHPNYRITLLEGVPKG